MSLFHNLLKSYSNREKGGFNAGREEEEEEEEEREESARMHLKKKGERKGGDE